VGSIHATEEGEVRRWRGEESSNHVIEEGEVRRWRGYGSSNHAARKVGSIHDAEEGR
jgi:hypothetical protein